MSPTKRYETPCCLCITSPQVRVKKMVVFDHLREISKVGLIALEKSVSRTYRIFCHPAWQESTTPCKCRLPPTSVEYPLKVLTTPKCINFPSQVVVDTFGGRQHLWGEVDTCGGYSTLVGVVNTCQG